MNKDNSEERNSSWLDKYVIHIGASIGVILGLVLAIPILTGSINKVQKIKEISARSDAHSVLIEAYRDCRQKILSGTRNECLIEMKSRADIDGISEEFEVVYMDLKSEIWASNKDG